MPPVDKITSITPDGQLHHGCRDFTDLVDHQLGPSNLPAKLCNTLHERWTRHVLRTPATAESLTVMTAT